jgi:hypothetical protein
VTYWSDAFFICRFVHHFTWLLCCDFFLNQRVSRQTVPSLEQKLLIIFPSILFLIKPIKVIKEYIKNFKIKYYVWHYVCLNDFSYCFYKKTFAIFLKWNGWSILERCILYTVLFIIWHEFYAVIFFFFEIKLSDLSLLRLIF